MSEQHSELKNIVEAALLASESPLSVSALASLFPEDAKPSADQLKEVFEQLDRDYEGRGVELRRVGKGYRFQSREKYSPWLRKLSEGRPPRYSRAFLETLAIIAYRQPVTRGDIEEIRGVTVSSDIMRQLLDRDWVKEVGHRDVPGRPALLGTTQQFLEYFNLEALSDLPPLLERREAADIARELNLRLPLESQEESEEGSQEKDQDTETQDDGQTGTDAEVEGEAVDAAADEALAAAEGGQEGAARDGSDGDSGPDNDPESTSRDDADTRPTAQVIPIDGAMPPREGDGETS